MEIIPEEAETIRRMAKMLLDGESRQSVARWLNSQGLTTSTGKQWTHSAVDMMLKAPRLYGMRQHNGKLFQGHWEPIFAASEFAELQEALSRTKNERKNEATDEPPLIRRLPVCALCDSKMSTISTRYYHNKKFERRYACAAPGCGRVAILTRIADQAVRDALATLKLPIAKSKKGKGGSLGQQLAEARNRLEAWDTAMLAGSLDPTVWSNGRPTLAGRIASLEAQETACRASETAASAIRGGEGWWLNASPAEQREAVTAALLAVRIHPAKNDRPGGRVEPVWNFGALLEAGMSVDVDSLSPEEIGSAHRAVNAA